jgi:hypothetical protein
MELFLALSEEKHWNVFQICHIRCVGTENMWHKTYLSNDKPGTRECKKQQCPHSLIRFFSRKKKVSEYD